MSLVGRIRMEELHEAMAWALDAERQLGCFNYGEPGRFPLHRIDTVADQLLAWLDYHGFEMVPREADENGSH